MDGNFGDVFALDGMDMWRIVFGLNEVHTDDDSVESGYYRHQ